MAQTPTFTRPGTITVVDMIGRASAVSNGQEKPLKLEERVRAEVVLKTQRVSTLTLEFSNGATAKLGSDSELSVEEFWQQPHSQAGKTAEWKQEPSPSRTRLKLVRGDVSGTIKPLQAARGSTFTLELVAGTLRLTEGVFTARMRMTELGIGVCTVDLASGEAEFEPVNGTSARITPGKRLAFAVEINPANGAVTLGDLPKPDEAKGKQ